MGSPHITQEDRDALDDRGLVNNDHTPDMRKPPATDEVLHHHAAEGFQNPPTRRK